MELKVRRWLMAVTCFALVHGCDVCPSGQISMERFDASGEEVAAASAMRCYDSLDKRDRGAFTAMVVVHAGGHGTLDKLHGMTASEIAALAYGDEAVADATQLRKRWQTGVDMNERVVRECLEGLVRVAFRQRGKGGTQN